MLDWLTNTLGIEKTTTVGGLLGAILSIAFLEHKTSPVGKALAVFGGWAIAHFLTVPLIEYFGLSERWYGGMGFLLGLFGMLGAAAVARAIKAIDILKFLPLRSRDDD